jgi:predicted CopG family antitoxin
MTECKTIKVSKEAYAELSEVAGELQIKLKRPVSMDETIKHLVRRRRKAVKISDFAGLWEDMTDEEAEGMEAAIDQAWKNWRIQQ